MVGRRLRSKQQQKILKYLDKGYIYNLNTQCQYELFLENNYKYIIIILKLDHINNK